MSIDAVKFNLGEKEDAALPEWGSIYKVTMSLRVWTLYFTLYLFSIPILLYYIKLEEEEFI